MNKTNVILVSLICLSILLQISFILAWSDDGTATQNVDGCNTLNTTNAVYTLIQNVSSTGTCFTIQANNITVDCDNYLINYSTTPSSSHSAVSIIANSSTVKNCFMEDINVTGHGSFGYDNNPAISISYGGNYYHTFYNNKITIWEWSSEGITGALKNSNISNNVITTYGINGDCFSHTYSINNTFSNNILTTYGITGVLPYDTETRACINLFYSDNNIFSNNVITTYSNTGDGIKLKYDTNNNIFSNNVITTYGNARGVFLKSGTSINDSYSNMNITSISGIPFYFYSGNYNDFILKDSILNYTSNSESKEIFISSSVTGTLNFSNVRETDGNCINITCPIGVTCYSDCGSITIFIPPMEWEEVDLDEFIVNPDNPEQGLLPSIYYGMAIFLSNIMTPAIIIIFVVFICLIMVTIGTIIKKIAMKI